MESQWKLQKQILNRTRSLGLSSQLPAFQGNVPVQLKQRRNDSNITEQGDTGWMDSTDPLFAQIADVWMQTLIEDFGTDHWYQMDGFVNTFVNYFVRSQLARLYLRILGSIWLTFRFPL